MTAERVTSLTRRAALWAALVLILVHPAAAGGEGGGHFLPGSAVQLRDGDIILNYTPSPLNSFNRLYAKPEGPYAHALVYVVFPGLGGRVVDFSAAGLVSVDADETLAGLYEVALVRLRKPPPAGKLAAVAADMKRRHQEGKITFDFGFRWTPDDDGRYYCTEFVSQLFRQAGLADPFPLPPVPEDDFWVEWCARNLDLDLRLMVSPNAVLFLPEFELAGRHHRKDQVLERREAIFDALLQRAGDYIREQGMSAAPPSLGSRLMLGLAGAGLFEASLIGGLPEKSRRFFVTLQEFAVMAGRRVERTIALNEDETWTREEIVALTRRTADALRDRYFVRE